MIPIALLRSSCITAALIASSTAALAQQTADLDYAPEITRPAYAQGAGPKIGIDEAHGNFHTVSGRYQPFANLLRRDGFRVEGFKQPFTRSALEKIDILVIANPLHPSNSRNWTLPTPSAFSPEEIEAIVEWVDAGGALLLIADHMPFPGAAKELALAFGATFSNGYAKSPWRKDRHDLFALGEGLIEGPLTRGRAGDPPVTAVATFGGSAFTLPKGATPLLVFGPGSVSRETTKAPGITPDAPTVAVEGWSQGATLEHGKGRVAIFGEAGMFTAQHSGPKKRPMGMNVTEAAQNYQFILNVARWLGASEL